MDKVRLKHTLRLCLIWGACERAEYLRKQHVFKSIGEHCEYMPRIVPLYPNLIKIGDYVSIASNVSFFTHDGIHKIIGNNNDIIPNNLSDYEFKESIGCIEIGNHVFIAANASIGYNVKIGDNVIITSGSVVANDIPSNSVVRGNPAKVVCTLTQFLSMKAAKNSYPNNMSHEMGKFVGKELEEWLWNDFYKSREKK